MSEYTPSPEADLSYLKSLAEAGERTPLVGGSFGVLWGALYTPPPLLLYAHLTQALTLPDWLAPWLFVIPLPLGILGSIWLGRSVAAAPGAQSQVNRAASAAWIAAGSAMFLVTIGGFAAQWLVGESDQNAARWGGVMAVVFAVYGAAYATTALVSGFKGQALFGGLSLIAAAMMIVTMGMAEQLLVFGLALPLVSIVPGLIILARQPKHDNATP